MLVLGVRYHYWGAFEFLAVQGIVRQAVGGPVSGFEIFWNTIAIAVQEFDAGGINEENVLASLGQIISEVLQKADLLQNFIISLFFICYYLLPHRFDVNVLPDAPAAWSRVESRRLADVAEVSIFFNSFIFLQEVALNIEKCAAYLIRKSGQVQSILPLDLRQLRPIQFRGKPQLGLSLHKKLGCIISRIEHWLNIAVEVGFSNYIIEILPLKWPIRILGLWMFEFIVFLREQLLKFPVFLIQHLGQLV